MDATTLLKKDHDVVRELFRAFARAGADADARRTLYRSIRHELQTHSRVEEQVFYPAVMRVRAEPAREAVRGALENHHMLDGLLAEIDELEPEDARYAEKVRALEESVERHIDGEEEAIFAQARIHLTDERLERLGRDMAMLRESLVGEPVAAGVDARPCIARPAGVGAGAAPGRPPSPSGGAGPGRRAIRDRSASRPGRARSLRPLPPASPACTCS
jgi:hemerythrin superfamily protein